MFWNLLNNIILKNILADDEKSIIKDDDLSIDIFPESSDKEGKSVKDKLKSDVSKTIIKGLTGQGLLIKISIKLLMTN